MQVSYTRGFIKRFNKCEEEFQKIIIEKIDEFRHRENHKRLKVHKLHGKFSMYFSFSVNYKTRIVFEYISKTETVLLSIGDHEVYD